MSYHRRKETEAAVVALTGTKRRELIQKQTAKAIGCLKTYLILIPTILNYLITDENIYLQLKF